MQRKSATNEDDKRPEKRPKIDLTSDEEDVEEEDEDEEEIDDPVIKQFNEEEAAEQKRLGRTAKLLAMFEGKKPTIEDLRALPKIYVTDATFDHGERMMNAFDEAIGGFFMMNTHSSSLLLDCFDKELKKARRIFNKNPSQGFEILFPLTDIMQEDTWFHDTEIPGDVCRVMTYTYKLWKDVLDKSVDELGLAGQPNAKQYLL
jgi:hypothetical protein